MKCCLLPKQLEPCILLKDPLLLLDDWSIVVILGASGVSTEKLFILRFNFGPLLFCGGLCGAETGHAAIRKSVTGITRHIEQFDAILSPYDQYNSIQITI